MQAQMRTENVRTRKQETQKKMQTDAYHTTKDVPFSETLGDVAPALVHSAPGRWPSLHPKVADGDAATAGGLESSWDVGASRRSCAGPCDARTRLHDCPSSPVAAAMSLSLDDGISTPGSEFGKSFFAAEMFPSTFSSPSFPAGTSSGTGAPACTAAVLALVVFLGTTADTLVAASVLLLSTFLGVETLLGRISRVPLLAAVGC
jgi:hypothetical protein